MTDTVLLEQGSRQHLVLTGAFLSGAAVTPPEDGYDRVQGELVAGLAAAGHAGWQAGERGLDDPTLARYAMDGSGSMTVPLFLLVRRGGDLLRQVQAAVEADDAAGAALDAADRAFDWRCSDAQVTFGEAGIATLRVTYELTARRDLTPRQARGDLEASAATLAQPLALVVEDAGAQFLAAVGRLTSVRGEQPWWYLDTVDADQSPQHRAQLLWLHRIVVLAAPRDAHPLLAERGTGLLPYTFRVQPFGDVVVLTGILTSVVVHCPGDPFLPQVLDMIDLEYEHYALTAELDRALFARLRALQTDAGRSVASLDAEATAIAGVLDRVGIHRAGIDTMLVDFGGGAIELWEAVAAVARQDHLDRSVDRKLDALGAAYRVRIDQAATRRQRRLDGLAFFFASLTLATSVIAAAEFGFGGPAEGPIGVRVVVLVASVALLVVLLVLYARFLRHGHRRG